MPTWSTGYNLKGAAGLSILTGSGAPAANLGALGQTYFDTAAGVFYGAKPSATSWAGASQTSLVGPKGADGAAGVTSFLGAMQGPVAQLTGNALSATPVVLNTAVQSSTTPQIYVPPQASYLMGGNVYVAAGTAVLELWDQTASVSIYKTASLAAGSVAPLGPFAMVPSAAGGYPLVSGNTYVWRATGSGTAALYVDPMYYDTVAAGVSGFGSSTMASCYLPTVTSTFTAAKMIGNASFNKFIRMSKQSYFYQATIQNTGTTGTATVYCSPINNGTISATALCGMTDASGAIHPIQPGETFTTPAFGTAFPFVLGQNYVMAVAGNTNGVINITYKVAQ